MRVWCIDGQSADMNGESCSQLRTGRASDRRHTSPAAEAREYDAAARRQSPRANNASHPELETVTQDINVLALVKGEERYIFLYDDERKSEALRTLGRFASNPELSFSWYDAAVLSQRIRQTALEQRVEEEVAVPASRSRFKLPLASEE
jgi:hypothetical protein